MSEDSKLLGAISEQYGAALQMLQNAITNCPDELWSVTDKNIVICQVIYHTLYFTDIYLSRSKAEWESFTGKLGENGDADTYIHEPEKSFTKQELLDYVSEIRTKAKDRLSNLSIQDLNTIAIFTWHGSSILASLLYNLRHIMLHVGALHVRINAVIKEPLACVSKAPLT